MLRGDQIAAADLTEWRKLAQGLHARYLVADFGAAARFVAAVGAAGDAIGRHPRVSIGTGRVDLELVRSADAQGRGTPGDEIRDATGRVPNLWFGDADEDATPGQRFHVEVYVAPEAVQQRVAAAVAAGGTVVDDSRAPGLTVIADQDGNRGVVCADLSAAHSG